MSRERKSPTKRVLKGAILWCARWMLGDDGEFYRGKVEVTLSAPKESERIVVVSSRGMSGLTEPTGLGVTPTTTQATPAELVTVLFSRDEVRILSEMLGDKTQKAKSVMDGCKISESKFWVLWSNLQQRGVVVDADEGEGFVIGRPWVREMIRARAEGLKPAA